MMKHQTMKMHQKQQVIPQTTAISNIKLLILKKEEYDIWAMEMEHYFEYIDNDVWKVIQNGNSKKRILTGKDRVIRILPPVSPAEIHAVEKERKARTILLMAIPKEHLRRFHGMDDAKEIWEAIRTRFGGNANSKKMQKAILKQQFKRDSFYQDQGAGKKEQKHNCLLTMDDGVVNWGEHTVEEEESNHALMAISSNNEVSLCSKTCIDSYNKLKTLCDEQMNQLGDQEAQILAYSQAVKKLEAQLRTSEPEPSVSDDRSSEFSTCQSNDSAGSIGSSLTILKNWNAMMERELGEGYSFTKKKCFVCGSLSHLIKDCDYYEKKMAREAEFKKQRVFNTGNGVAKPVGHKHINSVRPNVNTGRVNVNSVRPNVNTGRVNVNSVKSNVNTGRTNVNPVRPRVNTGSSNVNTVRSRQPVPTKTSNSFSPKRPQVNQLNQRRHFSKSHSPVSRPIVRNTARMTYSHAVKGNWGTAVKTSAGYNWRKTRPNSNYDSRSNFVKTVNVKGPQGRPKPVKAWIVDFLRGSNLRYALTTNPTIYDSLVKQFWHTATANTLADRTLELHVTIDTIVYTITEASIRNKLQLADASGITMLPNNEIFEGMGHMGYPTDGSFTFWKSFFTPQWRFLVHHILHCISSKSGGWDQFGSNIATALICLSTGRVYNFSKLIFDGMVANLKSKTKFLMYPRFLQLILDIQTENKHPYLAVTLTKKIFGNMKRGFRGAPRPLLPAMLLVATTNPSAGQEHPDVAQSQPSSSTIPVPSTSLPPEQSPPPIPTLLSQPTSPTPSPAHEPIEHIFEQPIN
ncbi:hypothetical protein Tco_1209182 [Tanacetum coccineum]